MEKHKCKLCSRKFSSGKAMGGHMRSHLMNLPLPPKTPPQKQDSGGHNSESTLSLYSMKQEEEEGQFGRQSIPRSLKVRERAELQGEEEIKEEVYLGTNYGLRENPRKSLRIIDPEFLDAGSSVVHDKESESESTKKPTRRRSKRIRRMFVAEETIKNHQDENKEEKSAEFEPVMSSFSDNSPEEDIAFCLMMLSKDVWRTNTNSSYTMSNVREKQGQQGKCYKCEICNKVLKSSQALGSHKTIHKKTNLQEVLQEKERKLRLKNVDDKVHECPFCGKIYGSGQALGGHKRSHILSLSTTASSSSKVGDSLVDSSSANKFPNGFIDLNMPAPMEDEDFSQQEVSAVS